MLSVQVFFVWCNVFEISLTEQQPTIAHLHQSRHYSQFLSLQLKARFEGIPTPVYAQASVHHLR